MSERERWIVYPLLFLALGAALRDKIIKTTESQRIKCQGLAVFDSDDQPLLVLGPEQFPEMFRPNAPDILHLDEVKAKRVVSDVVVGASVVGDQFTTNKDRIGRLVANEVVAGNYVLSDGKNSFRIDGRYTVPLFYMLRTLQQSIGPPRGEPAPNSTSGQAPSNSTAGEADSAASVVPGINEPEIKTSGPDDDGVDPAADEIDEKSTSDSESVDDGVQGEPSSD